MFFQCFWREHHVQMTRGKEDGQMSLWRLTLMASLAAATAPS